MSIKISLADHSQYFKGLLLLIRKDNHIHEEEKKLVMRIGKILGFEKEFCENAIREILGNEHIIDEPPKFSDLDVAKCFIQDGIQLALIDNHLHDEELAWLSKTAEINNISNEWLEKELASTKSSSDIFELSLAAQQFEMQ